MTLEYVVAATLEWLAVASWQLAIFIGLVACAVALLRKASPRLRHGLWLLVFIKALLPTTLGGELLNAPWAVGQWGVRPLEQQLPAAARQFVATDTPVESPVSPTPAPTSTPATQPAAANRVDPATRSINPYAATLFGLWAGGVTTVLGGVAIGYLGLVREVRRLRSVEEGPVRIALERAALAVGVTDAQKIDLRITDRPAGTFLFGVRRPTIVLPQAAVDQLAPDEILGVLAHELVHWRRRDTLVGWLQAVVGALFWFHPLVWWASARLREERERCCDDAVLRHAVSDRDTYGEAIVRSLTIGRGRPIGLAKPTPLAAAGLVGVFERGATLQQRLEDVMNFRPTRQKFGWRSMATLVLFGLIFLPMAGSSLAQLAPGDTELVTLSLDDAAESATRIETDRDVKVEGAASTRITTQWPTTVCLAEVEKPDVDGTQLVYTAQVKSDLDQSASLEMWAHVDGGTYFSRNPQVAVFGKSDWKRLEIPFFFKAGQRPDKVTLNVIIGGPGTVWVDDIRLLKRPLPGGFGAAAPANEKLSPVKKEVADKAPVVETPYPQIVESIPEFGATDVDPSLDTIRVTFDRDMSTPGMSWTGGGEDFPDIDKSRQAEWIDARICVLPVRLAKAKFYRVGVNSKSFQNFKSADGKPAEHRVLSFATAGAKRSVQRKAHIPEIAELSPANGDGDVDPDTKTISVTFDTKMGGGMSWVRTGGWFPGAEDGRAWWSKDGRTCTLPVALEPGVTYQLSLNGSHYVNFQSQHGVPAPTTVWSFTTEAE
ncbi:Regulatory protein BlaR1 [Botrimarina colliarenosi]|uniref:Regulatory protein BlaR1 n=1 Tax=Botrimarina colliarenosi TaxID=2528001 RepID=A0A5C6ACK2_9BACT|nr:M56 family metallopeptidase [Botrimarina colliarenosi]TWT96811.1 Regulatory protein BlaR1 [Botrimarina colliarenosi]